MARAREGSTPSLTGLVPLPLHLYALLMYTPNYHVIVDVP